jgi:hypothetical protein
MSTGNPSNVNADLSTLSTDVSAQEAYLASVEAQLAAAQAQVVALQATNATQAAQLVTDAALIATLEAELNTPPPAPPNAPTNVVATAGVQSAALTWTAATANGSAVTGYFVQANGGLGQTVSGTTATYTGLTAGVPYTFTVVAESGAGNGPAGTSNTVTPSAPVTPPTSPAIANLPPNPATLLVSSTAQLGAYYLPTPTVTMQGTPTASGQSGNAAAIGATSYQVIDESGIVVSWGTMVGTAVTITPCNVGVLAGSGTTILPGFYTVGCSNGATGSFVVNAATDPLYRPKLTDPPTGASAYEGSSNDRDTYATPQSVFTLSTTPQQSAATLIAAYKADPYFTGPQDAARPRRLWIASSTQPSSPTVSPTASWWGQLAAALVAGGVSGSAFELPFNEPENGGFSITAIIAAWQAAATAVLAADPTAQCWGYDSGGFYNNSPISNLTQFLNACGPRLAGITNHMESTKQNNGDSVLLGAYFGGIKAANTAAGYPLLDYRNTENGEEGGQYGVLQPRRDIRWRTMLRFMAELVGGWRSQNQYDFKITDTQGSGQPMYSIDKMFQNNNGNVRGGFQGVHVFNAATWGTTCTPASPPARLSFGPSGSVGDSLFFGGHYSGTKNDVVVLGNNGVVNASVTLAVSATGTVPYWNGVGVPGTLPVVAGTITVPEDDLLTYVFLPPGSTVSVVDTDQGVVSASNATDLALTATVTNETGAAVASVHNGNWGENNSGVTGVSAPYKSATVPASISANFGTPKLVSKFAYKGPAPAWQEFGSSVITYTAYADGVAVHTSTDPTAVSYAVPSPSCANSSDPCTRTTWWQMRYSDFRRLPTPVTCTTFEITVTAAGYGGQPDAAASADATAKYHEGDTPNWSVAEIGIF